MEGNTPPKSNTLSSQVLEYFTKYSGDQNLSSYLRGIAPKHENKVRQNIDVNKLVDDGNVIVHNEDKKMDQTVGKESNMSPTSSLTSNRKLEWDNGADIGYENSNNRANLHKSFSLPTLTTLEKIELGKQPLKSSLECNVENSARIYYSSSGSSNEQSDKPAVISTTTTSSSVKDQKLDTTSSSSFAFKPWIREATSNLGMNKDNTKFLYTRVGSPVAQSTPNIERPIYKRGISLEALTLSQEKSKECTVTSKSNESSEKPEGNNMVTTELKCVAKFIKSKIVRMAVTKPILIDCVNYKQYDDKDIQTVKSIKFKSIGTQTEPLKNTLERSEKNQTIPCNIEKQVIEYVKHSDSSDRPGSRSLGTNTESDLLSNCNSFEFLYPTDTNPKDPNLKQKCFEEKAPNLEKLDSPENLSPPSPSNNPNNPDSEKFSTSTKSSNLDTPNINEIQSGNSEKSLNSNNTETSSKGVPLGEMISCNLSSHLTIDIDKSISLLLRLLKSKRYDKVTKEYFVKKIVEKILKSNYSSDSSTSLNNEEQKKKDDDAKTEGSSSSSKVSEKLVEPSLKQRLQENVPWIPASFSKKVMEHKKLDINTFSEDIFPEPKRKVKDPRFTITSSILQYHQPKFFEQPPKKLPINSPHSLENDNKVDTTAMKTWKDDITQSERLFESRYLKADGDKTDTLVKFAKKERENQINWINDEISHLNKLKNLLQQNNLENVTIKNNSKPEKPNVEIEVLTKPHVEDMKKMKKSAAVYVITTDRKDDIVENKTRANSIRDYIKPTTSSSPDVKEAKLVTSEVYKTDKPFTCIRRYVFEIPVQCGDIFPNNQEIDEKIPRTLSSKQDATTEVYLDLDSIPLKNASTGQAKVIQETYISREMDSDQSLINKAAMTDPKQASFRNMDQEVQTQKSTRVIQPPDSEVIDNRTRRTSLNSIEEERNDIFTRGTQASDTEFVDNKRKVHSVAEVPHLPLTPLNVVTSRNMPKSSRSRSEELANVVLNKGKESSDISFGANAEENRLKQQNIEAEGGLVPLMLTRDHQSKSGIENRQYQGQPLRPYQGQASREYEGPASREYYAGPAKEHEGEESRKTYNYHRTTSDYARSDPEYTRPDSDYTKPTSNYMQSATHSARSAPNYSQPAPDYVEADYIKPTSEYSKPDYGKPAPDYSRSGSDYTRRPPDYIKPASEHTKYDPDYARSAFDRPAPDYSRSGSDYARHSSGYVKPASEPTKLVPEYTRSASDYRPDANYSRPAPDYEKPGLPKQRSYASDKKYLSPTSSNSSTSTSSSSQTILIKICPCCKRKESEYRSVLKDLPDAIDNALCQPCNMNTNMVVDPMTGQYHPHPDHICKCYTLMKTEAVNKIKSTIKRLEQLENEKMQCSCSSKKCKCPTRRTKKGIAYTLTLDGEDTSESSEQDFNRKQFSDEVKLKIPTKKAHRSKKEDKKRHRKHHKKHKKDGCSSKMTLQEYLSTNRPNFVQNAEERRKKLIDLAYMREQRCQKYKQLLAMTNGVLPVNSADKHKKSGLYSSKEMKEITAKNYKKLPEVQQKLKERRESNNKKANRLLASIFNKADQAKLAGQGQMRCAEEGGQFGLVGL